MTVDGQKDIDVEESEPDLRHDGGFGHSECEMRRFVVRGRANLDLDPPISVTRLGLSEHDEHKRGQAVGADDELDSTPPRTSSLLSTTEAASARRVPVTFTPPNVPVGGLRAGTVGHMDPAANYSSVMPLPGTRRPPSLAVSGVPRFR